MIELPALVRFVHLTATVLLAGSFAFTLMVARHAYRAAGPAAKTLRFRQEGFQRRIVRWSVVTAILTAVLGLWLQTAAVSEGGQAAPDFAAAVALVIGTQYGNAWLGRMVLLSLIALGGFVRCHHSPPAAVGLFLSAGLLASNALSGHAAAADGAALAAQLTADSLHLLASGVWLGGLAPLAALIQRCHWTGDGAGLTVAREAVRRFSLLALASVSVLLATGGINAWNLVGGVPQLFGTPYGRLLLLKLGLLLPLLAVAALNLLRLKPQLTAPSSSPPVPAAAVLAKVRRNAIIEMALGVMILFVVGGMGSTPPARHVQADWPFSFRWSWSALERAPKARAEVARGAVWGAVGAIALLTAAVRRRRRVLTSFVGIAILSYAGVTVLTPVSIDAYPTTYARPAISYQAISVANGKMLYRDSCAVCHGADGYGDGAAAEDLSPKPADLTARHAADHTAGDLFWWLTAGGAGTGMPSFAQTLSPEERWDVINFVRALASADKARALAPIVEDDAWLVAPDFVYGADWGDGKALKDERGRKTVLLIFFSLPNSAERLRQLEKTYPEFRAAEVELVLVPAGADDFRRKSGRPDFGLPIVNEGSLEIAATYALFSRSFAEEKSGANLQHMELLIDKQGYIRARWLAAESDAWRKPAVLFDQIQRLRNEIPRAPAPDEHVH